MQVPLSPHLCQRLWFSFFFFKWPFLSSLEKYQFSSLAPLKLSYLRFLLWLSCRSSLYILDTDSLFSVWFANMFSHFMSCLFTLLFSLLCRSFKVWYSPDSVFSFCYLCYWCHIQEIITFLGHKVFSPVFSFKNFKVLGLMSRSLIHFD